MGEGDCCLFNFEGEARDGKSLHLPLPPPHYDFDQGKGGGGRVRERGGGGDETSGVLSSTKFSCKKNPGALQSDFTDVHI